METDKIMPNIALSFVFGLVVGLFMASLYVTFQRGISFELAETFNIFAFWYQTPLYLGYVTPVFYHCLFIIGGTASLVMLVPVILRLQAHDEHGSARWANFHELQKRSYIKRFGRIRGPIFGKTTSPFWFGRYLTNGDQPHSLVVAPTRAGKGVGVVIPTLLTFEGSVLALDVKGELFDLTSRLRAAKGDKVFRFSPYAPDERSHCYNPVLDIVALPPERRFTETRRLAAALITVKGTGAEGFLDGARDLFVAGILACIERGTPTIGAVYDLFTLPGEKYKLFAQLAEETQSKEAQRIFDNMAANDTKILTSYTSVLGDGGLNLWADPLIKAATSRSDFSIYDLRREKTSIYLCVSPNDLEIIAPLMRLIFQQTVSILQRSMPGKDEPNEVLFLMDEFKHLGRLETIETAITTIAGYRGRFMIIIQSLSAITGSYNETGKQNFLGNTGIQVFMATGDDETPNYISKSIGEYTYRARSKSYNQGHMFEANVQLSDQGAPLLRPEQVRLLDDDTEIVLIKGQPPVRLPKVKYYSDRRLKPIFESQQGAWPLPPALVIETIPETKNAALTEEPHVIPEENTFNLGQDEVGSSFEDELPSTPPPDYMSLGGSEGSALMANHDDIGHDDTAEEQDSPHMAAQRNLLDQIIAMQRQKSSRH
jgi:type IV secretion system protein VirD4